MKILKRNLQFQELSFDKILYRLKALATDEKLGVLEHVDIDILAQQVIARLFDGVSSAQLDELAAQLSIAKSTTHPDYATLASRIAISNMHKNIPLSFTKSVKLAYKHDLVTKELVDISVKYESTFDQLDCNLDYLIDYFGFKTLEKGYLLKLRSEGKPDKIIERPQYMWLRVAIGIHGDNFQDLMETYNGMGNKYFTHATPTLFNAGTPRPQLSSCYLMSSVPDSIEGIFKTITDCAKISKYAGGIGVPISDIRANGSIIKGTNGKSDGIIPMLKVHNSVSTYINQGGKRNGSYAEYLEPWHADVYDFLELKKNHGDEAMRARDLFYALWIPDMFMRKVEEDGDWYLMCPNECPGLTEVYGTKFDDLYNGYVESKKYRQVVKARDLWNRILVSQIETGTPYLCSKDSANIKSNQKNIGTIKSSNLCAEVMLYTNNEQTAVCNLASISLGMFVEGKEYNHVKLAETVKICVRNLDKVIDRNFYPIPETRDSNMLHRPVGLGVQGLASVFFKLRLPFESPEAAKLNREIFETIQFAALSESCALSKKLGSYSTFKGSPYSEGIFQHNLWGFGDEVLSGRWDWAKLRNKIQLFGLRNSQLTALMPTASTAQILSNTECFEPITSNFYIRKVLSGEFPVVNKYLVQDLMDLGLWNVEMKDQIIAEDGSIQKINEIPQDLKDLYKTVWEIKQKTLIDLSADRGMFVDQSQSLNLFMANPTIGKLSSMHFYSWKKGCKTMIYYLRSKSSSKAMAPTLGTVNSVTTKKAVEEALSCSIDNKDDCLACGS